MPRGELKASPEGLRWVERPGPWRRLAGCGSALVSLAAWGYLLTTVAIVVCLHVLGDRWWLGTLLLFAPRWVWGLPLILLVPLVISCRPRLTWIVFIAALLCAGPLMGLCVPWPQMAAAQPKLRLRVLSCNTGGGSLDREALGALIARLRPDVVALQEFRNGYDPDRAWQGDLHVVHEYNLCVASRFPVERIDQLKHTNPPGLGWIVQTRIDSPIGPLDLFNLHLPTPRSGLEALRHGDPGGIRELQESIRERTEQARHARQFVDRADGPLLVTGDFNMPVESRIYRATWSDLTNAFSTAGWGYGRTKFTRWHGVRIDHILAGSGWRCVRCWIGPHIGSDHRPVIADLEWYGPVASTPDG